MAGICLLQQHNVEFHVITVLSFRDTEIEQITFFWSTDAFTGFDLPERIAP